MDAAGRLETPGPQTRTSLPHSRQQELHCRADSSCPSGPTRVIRRGPGGCWTCSGFVSQLGDPKLREPRFFCHGLQANWLPFSLEEHLSLLYVVIYLSFEMWCPTHVMPDGEGRHCAFLKNDKHVLPPLKRIQERNKILVRIDIEKTKQNKKAPYILKDRLTRG